VRVWRTKAGKDILMSEMTIEHIENAISMIERKVKKMNIFSISSYYMKEIIFEHCHSENLMWI